MSGTFAVYCVQQGCRRKHSETRSRDGDDTTGEGHRAAAQKAQGMSVSPLNLTLQSRPDTCSFGIHKIQKHPFLLMASIIILG